VLEVVHHTIDVACPAGAIPDSIKIDVSGLALGQAVHAKELNLPPGVSLRCDPDLLLVHVLMPKADVEPAAEPGATSVEPEVIKRPEKPKEE